MVVADPITDVKQRYGDERVMDEVLPFHSLQSSLRPKRQRFILLDRGDFFELYFLPNSRVAYRVQLKLSIGRLRL